ncbi:MAG: AAA family ATPase [Rhodothermales bacterium]
MPPTLAPSPPTPHALLAALADPAAYPHRPERVEIVQTHISVVALAPPFVYKVKKPVDFGFLDFSTLARRRHFCEEEVRLNERLCPGLYEGVVPIAWDGDALCVEGEGEPVEVAVKMRRLDPAGFFDARLRRGALTTADLDRVTERLAAFYRGQPPSPEAAAWGWPERLRLSTDENVAQTERFVGDLIARPAFDALRSATDRFFAANARLLHRRRAEGRVVDGHGDLRLEHLHLRPDDVSDGDALCVYDCIEFNERFRCVDIASDLAFLAMDLDVHGRPDLAHHVVARMAASLDDPELWDVIDFYKGYRAYVRGKVEAMRSGESEVPEAERAASRARARRYFQLAMAYAVAGSEPLVIAVMGPVGAGKTTQAEALGAALGWEVVSSDRVRKAQAGVPLFRRGSEAERAALYAPDRTEAVYDALCETALRRASDGLSTVLDATFGTRRHRDALRHHLAAAGVRHRLVELTAPAGALRHRLAARADGTVVSDARASDFAFLAARYEPPDALEDPEHVRADAASDPEATTRAILTALAERSD